MAGYKENTRGRAVDAPPQPRNPPAPISDIERQQAAETARQAKALMPEVVPIVKELYELGMIDGWRNVTITPLNGDDNGTMEQGAEPAE